jgi:hypothetical protein
MNALQMAFDLVGPYGVPAFLANAQPVFGQMLKILALNAGVCHSDDLIRCCLFLSTGYGNGLWA